jgi:hypothetical protein
MSAARWFEVVSWLTIVLPLVAAGAIFSLPRPRRIWLRFPLAVLFGWLLAILFTALVYNPAGIAYGHAVGEHFPESRFDNSTVASTILGGWIFPALMCCVLALVQRIRGALKRTPDRNAVV